MPTQEQDSQSIHLDFVSSLRDEKISAPADSLLANLLKTTLPDKLGETIFKSSEKNNRYFRTKACRIMAPLSKRNGKVCATWIESERCLTQMGSMMNAESSTNGSTVCNHIERINKVLKHK